MFINDVPSCCSSALISEVCKHSMRVIFWVAASLNVHKSNPMILQKNDHTPFKVDISSICNSSCWYQTRNACFMFHWYIYIYGERENERREVGVDTSKLLCTRTHIHKHTHWIMGIWYFIHLQQTLLISFTESMVPLIYNYVYINIYIYMCVCVCV